MKNYTALTLCLLIGLLMPLFAAQRVVAQVVSASATSGMTVEQAKAIGAIKVANLDKDTYLKAGGFILDRYEERPAYVFTYTDGITRKIYLYKVFDAASTKELGLAAFYVNGKTNEIKLFVIPGADGDRKAWDAYIDDLKYIGEKEPGLMSTLTFVLSREMASLLSGGSSKAEGDNQKKEEYNFCFAADAVVAMADGSSKTISDVRAGDMVKSYDAVTRTFVSSSVVRTNVHHSSHSQDAFALAGVWVVPVQAFTASVSPLTTPLLLEATANHPVLTTPAKTPDTVSKWGECTPSAATRQHEKLIRKALGDVVPGELLYRYEAGIDTLAAHRVVRVDANYRTVKTVYNLVTEAGNYLINDLVVLDK